MSDWELLVSIRWLNWGSASVGGTGEKPARVGSGSSPQGRIGKAGGPAGPIRSLAAGGGDRIQREAHLARFLLHQARPYAAEAGQEPQQSPARLTWGTGN